MICQFFSLSNLEVTVLIWPDIPGSALMSCQAPPLPVSIPVSGDDPSPPVYLINLFDLIRLLLLIGCLRTFLAAEVWYFKLLWKCNRSISCVAHTAIWIHCDSHQIHHVRCSLSSLTFFRRQIKTLEDLRSSRCFREKQRIFSGTRLTADVLSLSCCPQADASGHWKHKLTD